jgi:hypothetical protein
MSERIAYSLPPRDRTLSCSDGTNAVVLDFAVSDGAQPVPHPPPQPVFFAPLHTRIERTTT